MKTSHYISLSMMAALCLIIAATVSFADTVTIYAGGKGGGYDSTARQIAKRLQQRGYETIVENRNGSDDITLQACQNPRSVWIAQIDAIYAREMKEGCYLPDVSFYGEEMAALFFPPKSNLSKLKHLTGDHKIFVDKVGSGTELTWRTMKAIEQEHGGGDDWIKAEPVSTDLRRATSLATRGKLHAALLVRKSNSKDFIRLLEAGWVLGQLYDKDINDLKHGDAPLYEARKLTLNQGKTKHKDWIYVVRSFIGTTEAVEMDDVDLMDALLGATE